MNLRRYRYLPYPTRILAVCSNGLLTEGKVPWGCLTEQQKTVVQLYYMDNLRVADIAERYNIPPHKAQAFLREAMEKLEDALSEDVQRKEIEIDRERINQIWLNKKESAQKISEMLIDEFDYVGYGNAKEEMKTIEDSISSLKRTIKVLEHIQYKQERELRDIKNELSRMRREDGTHVSFSESLRQALAEYFEKVTVEIYGRSENVFNLDLSVNYGYGRYKERRSMKVVCSKNNKGEWGAEYIEDNTFKPLPESIIDIVYLLCPELKISTPDQK